MHQNLAVVQLESLTAVLTTPWTNKIASFQVINKASSESLDLSMQILWNDDTREVLYSWGGMVNTQQIRSG